MQLKPKLLDLFSGAGGAGEGYRRAGFDVTGVDIKPQPRYKAGQFVQADALDYVAQYGWMFDAITASPPCQRYSRETPLEFRDKHPDLIALTRFWLKAIGVPYVIENVPDAAKLLINPTLLCGSMFGLKVLRHRYFECSWGMLFSPSSCCHDFDPVYMSGTKKKNGKNFDALTQDVRDASGIQWMIRKELDEAIPPVYTEWIGKHLMAAVLSGVKSPETVVSLVRLAAA